MVNDCFKDDTEEILHRIDANHMCNFVNLEIGGTVQGGYAYVKNRYDIVIQVDEDRQHGAG